MLLHCDVDNTCNIIPVLPGLLYYDKLLVNYMIYELKWTLILIFMHSEAVRIIILVANMEGQSGIT